MQELLREERQQRRWQQPRVSALTVGEAREMVGDSSENESETGGQRTTHDKNLTDGGCSGNAGRSSGLAHTLPIQATSSTSSATVPVRQETAESRSRASPSEDVKMAWWEGEETKDVPGDGVVLYPTIVGGGGGRKGGSIFCRWTSLTHDNGQVSGRGQDGEATPPRGRRNTTGCEDDQSASSLAAGSEAISAGLRGGKT